MSNIRQLIQIRTKKLGLLMVDARTARRRSLEECAQAMNVSPQELESYETGKLSPGLPQLELLAMFLNIPIQQFWGKQAISGSDQQEEITDRARLVLLRNRVIGASLRLARNGANFSYQEMTERTGIPEEKLKQYEMGAAALPMPELEILSQVLDVPIERFFDQHGPIGKWRNRQNNFQHFVDLPPELQDFISKPVNRPYLELAMRLSELNAEKLRGVAESLLEITY
jgi:transcriptional regulator with XRE-family HTH domain